MSNFVYKPATKTEVGFPSSKEEEALAAMNIEELQTCKSSLCNTTFRHGAYNDGSSMGEGNKFLDTTGLCKFHATKKYNHFERCEQDRGWLSRWFIEVWRHWGFLNAFNWYKNSLNNIIVYLGAHTIDKLDNKFKTLKKLDRLNWYDHLSFNVSFIIMYLILMIICLPLVIIPSLLVGFIYILAALGLPLIIVGIGILLIRYLGFKLLWVIPIFLIGCLLRAYWYKVPTEEANERGPYR